MPLFQVDFSFQALEFRDDEDSWMTFKHTEYVIADGENDAKKIAIEAFMPFFHNVTGKTINRDNWTVFLDHGVFIGKPKYLATEVLCASPWRLEKEYAHP